MVRRLRGPLSEGMLLAGLLFASWSVPAAAQTPPVLGRTCTDEISIGKPLCEPGQIDPTAKPFELFAKARSVPIAGANSANGLPPRFTAYVFDFNANANSGSLAPPIWHIAKRYPETRDSLGTMRFTLHNMLPPVGKNTFMLNEMIPAGDQPLNLHTHGMMVSPHDADVHGAYGDFVGVLACPEATQPACPKDMDALQMTEICGAAKSAANGEACATHMSHNGLIHGHEIRFGDIPYSIAIPADHPAGINWFHPHAHELSSAQVGAGLGGVITVGTLCADAALSEESRTALCAKGDEAALNDTLKERVLMLKDVEVFAHRPGSSDSAATSEASAEGYRVVPACKFSGDEPAMVTQGFCAFDATDDSSPEGHWLFTINGQIEPSISMQAGKLEYWRLTNLSSNATYKLSLCKSAPKLDETPDWAKANPNMPDPRGKLAVCDDMKSFRILSLDGGLIPGASRLGEQTELLLLPGARAEILIEPKAKESFTLVQKGFSEDDLYPPVVLATATTSAGTSRPPVVSFSKPPDIAARRPASFDEPEDCKEKDASLGPNDWASLPTKDEVVSLFFSKTYDYPEILTIGMMRGDPETSPDPQVRANFAACLKSGDPGTDACLAFAGTPFVMDHRNLCAKFGTKVTFRLYNFTDEIHNFHIHQQKFAVDLAAPAHEADPSAASARGKAMVQTAASNDGSNDPSTLSDGVPVLTSWTRDDHGRINGRNPVETVTMTFDRPEQVGDFVFHCHILEHEDKGMMKRITIYTPPTP